MVRSLALSCSADRPRPEVVLSGDTDDELMRSSLFTVTFEEDSLDDEDDVSGSTRQAPGDSKSMLCFVTRCLLTAR